MNAAGWWGRLRGLLEGGLGAADDGCLWCGGVRRGGGAATRLRRICGACAAEVPWIEQVQCAACGRGEPCPDCVRRETSFIVANRSAVQYTPFMKEWLARYKYRGSEKLAPMFGEMASYAYGKLRETWGDVARGVTVRTILTFVPLSERRLEERGFNQAETMARYVASRYRVPVVPVLVRTRHTEKQSYKSRRERLESLERAFALREDGALELQRLLAEGPLRVVVVDDVYTTGSTMQRCGEAIASAAADGAGALRVYGLTWAR
ncbi:ComF family protein [Paenibacillus antri]|uniref:ComF family protein n=1 Tax=Paenibacillus antri TaxID=2582848 RepID=A0A5R9G877_9BACL|nr:ComF family protein [Paenibacillus antri]TLS50566.1 ComF family protein [Paenibacillus antri]